MKPASVDWWKLKYDRIGLSSSKKGCICSNSGSASSSTRSISGTLRREAAISGGRSRNRFSRSGARSPRSRTVGARSSAGAFRSFTSGRVSREKSSSRASVTFDSSRKTGKIRNVSASASSREAVAVLEHPGGTVARGQLHVGLAQQRLLAQDRASVARDRGELLVQLDLRDRPGAALVEPLRLHLADVHSRDPHVRLLGERGRLREGHLDPVALRLERDRPPEGDPEEHQDAEAGEREGDHRDDAAEAGRLLDHLAHTPASPSASETASGRPSPVKVLQLTPPRKRRLNGPWASLVLNSETVFCPVQASQ